MSQAVIENPIINSPFVVPERHFRFTEEGITDEIAADRRSSSYFIPIARPKKKGKQLQFETEWTQDRIEENRFVNQVRERVKLWRAGGYVGITATTRRLLDYWTESSRERKLFFCQIEALETLIYITEVASKYGDAWIANDLRTANDTSNPGLPRVASKMATGSGKTVVMAMTIAWQALNKMANTQDARFGDAFLIVTPGITIRDRLRVLWPNDPENYYRKLDIVTSEQLEQLQQAKIIITNFHSFQLRETVKAGKLTKSILGQGDRGLFTETPEQMVRRVCRQLGNKKNIVVINDEAHHCYKRRPEANGEKLIGDERREAEKRDQEARIWISGIGAVKAKIGVKAIYEGWDANTVTHILGVRAFGTQLLCEQVVGRGLRRMTYATERTELKVNGQTIELDAFPAEYAEVYGVPFSFIPTSGSSRDPKPGPVPTHVRAVEERIACEITFPRLVGYRYDIPGETLEARFAEDSTLVLSTADLPTKVQLDPIVGETSIHTLDDLKRRRPSEVAFVLAKRTLEKYFRDDDGNDRPWLFPQVLGITRRWLAEHVRFKDNMFPQVLLMIEFSHDAADRIYKAIVRAQPGAPTLKPILRPYDTLGSTRYVSFVTIRPTYPTREDKCHISHVVAHTESWEQKMAETLEEMSEVVRYVKNQNLGFTIPYTINGEEHQYTPDFIAMIEDGNGRDDLLHLIVEVSGEPKKDKAAKVSTACTLWVPAVNNHSGFGRWGFIEIRDPWNAQEAIRVVLRRDAERGRDNE